MRRLEALANQRGNTDEETNAFVEEMALREIAIAEAPCDCLDAFKVKLRTVVQSSLIEGTMYRIDADALIVGMIAFMEGRH